MAVVTEKFRGHDYPEDYKRAEIHWEDIPREKEKSEFFAYLNNLLLNGSFDSKQEKEAKELAKKAKITKSKDGKVITVSDGVKSYSVSIRVGKKYLFKWDSENEIIDFLIKNYDVKWVKNGKFKRSDKGTTITISDGKNSLTLTQVDLTINDGRTDFFKSKEEFGEINVYEGTKAILQTEDGKVHEFPIRRHLLTTEGYSRIPWILDYYIYSKDTYSEKEKLEAKEWDKLSDKIGNVTDYGGLAFQIIAYILLFAGIGAIYTNLNAGSEVFGYMHVIIFIIIPILTIIGVATLLGKKAFKIVLSIFGLGGIASVIISSRTGYPLSATAIWVFLGIIVLLVLIGILIYSIATVIDGREKGLNPYRGIYKKFAILLSLMPFVGLINILIKEYIIIDNVLSLLIPFVGLITGIYYCFLKEGKDFNESKENDYTGAICFILFFISLPIYIIGFIGGWIRIFQ